MKLSVERILKSIYLKKRFGTKRANAMLNYCPDSQQQFIFKNKQDFIKAILKVEWQSKHIEELTAIRDDTYLIHINYEVYG